MRDPTRQEVLDSIFQGIRKAQEDYKKAFMSHICSSYAPEYLMTVNIFQSILRLKDSCGYTYGLSLEEPVRNLAEALRGKRVGSPQGARVNGRCDLSLRDVNDKPRAVIEVKKNAWDYWEDLGRLKYLVKQGLEFGIFASCWFEQVKDNNFKEAEDKLEEEIQFLHEYILDDVGKSGGNLSIERVLSTVENLLLLGETANQNTEWKWCPVCFEISHKENQR